MAVCLVFGAWLVTRECPETRVNLLKINKIQISDFREIPSHCAYVLRRLQVKLAETRNDL